MDAAGAPVGTPCCFTYMSTKITCPDSGTLRLAKAILELTEVAEVSNFHGLRYRMGASKDAALPRGANSFLAVFDR